MNKQEILSKLREKGMKTTPQRIIIFHKLKEIKGHIKADELYKMIKKEIPSISVSTVYRTLREFEDKGFIQTLPALTTYGLTIFDTNMEQHHHFICKICGKILDIQSKAVEVKLNEKHGDVENVTVVIKGICPSCRSKKNTSKR